MKGELFYSVLRYKHGLVLGESLNAGLLFIKLCIKSYESDYNLNTNNCTDFAIHVAKWAGFTFAGPLLKLGWWIRRW